MLNRHVFVMVPIARLRTCSVQREIMYMYVKMLFQVKIHDCIYAPCLAYINHRMIVMRACDIAFKSFAMCLCTHRI